MPYSVREEYQAVIVDVKGKFLGSLEGPSLRATLEQLRDGGKTQVVIDLSRTDFMDSSAIGALIDGRDLLRAAGGDVRLAGMQKRIRNLFLMTKLLGPVFEDYTDAESAAQSFRSAPGSGPRPEA